MLDINDCGPWDQIFSWEEDSKAMSFSWNATAMRDWAITHKQKVVHSVWKPTPAEVVFVIQNRGIEEEHIKRIDSWTPLRKQRFLTEPCLGVQFPNPEDGSITVDGHHRMVYGYLVGYTEFPVILLTWAQAEAFMLPWDWVERATPAWVDVMQAERLKGYPE